MDELDREDQKQIVKEAIREWLDEKYAAFGKWSLHGLFAAAVGYTAWFLIVHGWMK